LYAQVFYQTALAARTELSQVCVHVVPVCALFVCEFGVCV